MSLTEGTLGPGEGTMSCFLFPFPKDDQPQQSNNESPSQLPDAQKPLCRVATGRKFAVVEEVFLAATGSRFSCEDYGHIVMW